MKLAKRLLVLVAALAMVFSLTACGGDKFPKEYKTTEARGEGGEQVMSVVLEEDGTYVWSFYATESNGSGNKVMELTLEGDYTLADNTLTLDTAAGEGYYVAGASQTPFTCDKENAGMYANTMSMGSWVFQLNDDGTFGPVVE